MSSDLREFLFAKLRFKPTDCKICSALDSSFHIENAADEESSSSFFPEEFDHVSVPNFNLARQFGDDTLLKCAECGNYYTYRAWQPGGSDDAMRTYNHEAFTRIAFIEAHILLSESERIIEKYLHESPSDWQEIYNTHQQGLREEMDTLRKNAETIVKEGVEFLNAKVAEKMKVYKPESLEAEGVVAEVMARYLMTSMITFSPEVLFSMLDLLSDNRENVRKNLVAGFKFGLYYLREQPQLLGKIATRLQNMRQNPELKEALSEVQDLMQPFFKPVHFYSPAGDSFGLADETLKSYLEKLPGLKVTGLHS
jgi:hypothetical protein